MRHHRLGLLSALTAGLATMLTLLVAAPAGAIPPDGPSPDTPGTSSSVSPRTLKAGDVISFTVSGYPAGETLYIKIDDGVNCSESAIHGACVYYTQAIPSSGTVTGSFALPWDLTPGAHWLRFLASAWADPSDHSKGTIGFTRRGGADFTIVSPAPGEVRTNASGQSVVGAGGVAVIEVPEALRVPEAAATPATELAEDRRDLIATTLEVVEPGTELEVSVPDAEPGHFVSVWLHSDPLDLGWQQVTDERTVTVTVPDGTEPGEHSLVVLARDSALLGWTSLAVPDPAAETAVEPGTPEPVAAAESEAGFPVVGALAVGIALLAVIGVGVAILLRRRRGAAA